jgi:hypothetical protein
MLTVGDSMRKVQDQCLGALGLFETASAEVVKIGEGGKVDHLVEAQT